MAFCPHCGSQVSPETQFCPACGKQITVQTPPPPQQPQYAAQQPQYGAQQPQYGAQQPQYGAQQNAGQFGFNYANMAQAVPAPGFMECVKMFLRRWNDFNGRSRRSEFWWSCLGVSLFTMAAYILLMIFGLMCGASIMSGNFDAGGFFGIIFYLILFVFGIAQIGLMIPQIAITVRRLHDQGLSGWIALAMIGMLVPIVNFFISIGYIVLMCRDSQPTPNQWGPSPKYKA